MDLVNRTPQFEKEINKIFEGGDLKNSEDNDGSLLGIKNLEAAVALYDFTGPMKFSAPEMTICDNCDKQASYTSVAQHVVRNVRWYWRSSSTSRNVL